MTCLRKSAGEAAAPPSGRERDRSSRSLRQDRGLGQIPTACMRRSERKFRSRYALGIRDRGNWLGRKDSKTNPGQSKRHVIHWFRVFPTV